MSKLVDRLVLELKVLALPAPTLEHRFAAPKRQWRFDLCWPDRMIAVEVEGGIYNGGAHVRGADFEDDCEKYNAGVFMGWRILRFGPKGIRSGYAIRTIARALKNSGQTARVGEARPTVTAEEFQLTETTLKAERSRTESG